MCYQEAALRLLVSGVATRVCQFCLRHGALCCAYQRAPDTYSHPGPLPGLRFAVCGLRSPCTFKLVLLVALHSRRLQANDTQSSITARAPAAQQPPSAGERRAASGERRAASGERRAAASRRRPSTLAVDSTDVQVSQRCCASPLYQCRFQRHGLLAVSGPGAGVPRVGWRLMTSPPPGAASLSSKMTWWCPTLARTLHCPAEVCVLREPSHVLRPFTRRPRNWHSVRHTARHCGCPCGSAVCGCGLTARGGQLL